jgi:hypothetical protein
MELSQVARHSPEPFAFSPSRNLCPAFPWDQRSLGQHGIAPSPRSPSYLEQLRGLQEGDQGQGDDIYLT